jgi:tetratricopeptide (TPR) repeat protein
VALITGFPEVADNQPELVAEHLTLAGRSIEAIGYWRRAGERTLARYANLEAVAHFRKGLELVESIADRQDRAQQEVALLTSLGKALMAIEGYGASEAAEVFARAHTLCESLGNTAQLYSALRGLQSYYQVRGPLEKARDIGEQFLRRARSSEVRSLQVEAQRALGWCLFCIGELQAAKGHLETALANYDPGLSQNNIRDYGSDAGVLGLVNLGWLEWCAGNAERAIQCSVEAIELGQKLAHPLSLAYALCMSAAIHQSLQQPHITEELAEKSATISSENGFSYWKAWSAILRGWAMGAKGSLEEGISSLKQGIAAYRATGAELFTPYSLALLAETYGRVGRFTEGLACIDEAISSSATNSVHFLDAELFRIKALLVFSISRKPEQALELLNNAIAIASTQGARTLELRARNDLVTLQETIGASDSERSALRTLLSGMSETVMTYDVVRAKNILGGIPGSSRESSASARVI